MRMPLFGGKGGNDLDILTSEHRKKSVCGCHRSGVSERDRRLTAAFSTEMKNLCGFSHTIKIKNAFAIGKKHKLQKRKRQLGYYSFIIRKEGNVCKGNLMRVAVYDSFLTREQIEQQGAVYYEHLDDLLKDADIVSVHVPLVDATRNLITKRELDLMKGSAIIINVSRGGIINEEDLAEALRNHSIAGAGVDVFTKEPPATDTALLQCPNLIVSPHSAGQTRETIVRVAEMCAEGCLAILSGKKWPYVVDQAVYDHPRWAGKDWAVVE